MDSTLALLSYELEYDVKNILLNLLSNNESLVVNPSFVNCSFSSDFFLPNGLNCMGYPEKTAIEVKFRFNPLIVSRIYERIRSAIDKGYISRLVIVCDEANYNNNKYNITELYNGKVEIVDFSALKEKVVDKNIDKNKIVEKSKKDKAKECFKKNKITIFLGAGLSMDANLPGWNKLLEELLERKDEKPFKYINRANADAISGFMADSSIVTARYVIDGYRKSVSSEKTLESNDLAYKEVTNRIRNILYKNFKNRSNLVKAVASLVKKNNVKQVITYNYDDLLENQLTNCKSIVPVYNNDIPAENIKPIYHVHGYIPRNEGNEGIPILSEREYHHLYSRMHHWANVVQLNALYTTTCFFIGFSMNDPNQRRLLDLARNRDINCVGSEKANHYVFLKKQTLRGESSDEVNEEHCREVELIMYDLGLNVIWYDNHSDLPGILLEIANNSK